MLRLTQKRLFLFGVLLTMLLAGWLYWPTLQLPLIYDTLLHIRITGGLDFGSVWLPTSAFGFYRPMTFFPMLIIQQLFAGYPAWLLHGNNIVQHMVNAGLLTWLSWRLWSDWRRALAAGTIFALFPFSYQAVAVYGHNVHPAIVGLVLLGLHTYLTAVSRPNARKWWLLTIVLFLLMLITHETAVLFGGFAALVHVNAQPELLKQWRQLLRQPWRWFLLAGVIYLGVYQLLPIPGAPQTEATSYDLWLNGLYVLQAAVFPLAWFAHLLPELSGATVALVSGGLVTVMVGWLAWRQPAWRAPLLLAIGWWGAASALIGLALPTEYLLRGPRLLYLGSVGVALLWAHLLATLWQTGKLRLQHVWRLVGTAVFLFILITSGQFVRTKLAQYEQLTEPVRVWQANPLSPNTEVVLVNLPQWLDVPPNTYAIGVEFVAMLGDYLFVEELARANNSGNGPVWAVAVRELQTNQPYVYSVHAQHEWPAALTQQKRHIFITYFEPDGPQTRHTGYLFSLVGFPIPPPNPIAQFADYSLTEAKAEICAGTAKVALNWLTGRQMVPDTTSVFVQVLDADGRLLAQADGPPLGIRPGLLAAPPDTLLVDLREIKLPGGETAVPQTMLVGLYNFADGTRHPATDLLGQPLPDNAWRFPVADCP